MNSTFTLSKLDSVNLKKFGISLKDYKLKIKKVCEFLFNLKEISNNPVYNRVINKVRFDVCFCSDDTIHQINKDYRKKDSPTDVITFSLFADDKNAIIYRKTADLGQIIVSVETADKQKKDTLQKEILLLVTHGILHLLGFDHLEKKDYDFIIGIQDMVMNKVINNL